MLSDCPDPAEVADFHFLQLRTLRIGKKVQNDSEKTGNTLAAANKYGLLFTGTEEGFKVIKLDIILTLDEDKENRSIVENYSYDFVPSGTPLLLSVNASQSILAVCVKCASNAVINLYSLSTYNGSGSSWQPFCSNVLSPSGTEVRDFVWNPAMEHLYAVCFSDGSLQIHEVAGMSLKVAATLQDAGITTVCWSPKGKQLVAGKENGAFTQYKPNLAEVKTVPRPGVEESSVRVTSICWIANTLFAVVYVMEDIPNLFIVSTPKDSPCIYTNFYDVCLGNNSAPHQQYLLHLEPAWGILICASLDSIEIAVLGNMPNWVQWDLKEDGKALLPGKDGATNAIGMTVMYSAQRQLIISESESYPPMPILFLMTNNGLLVSFHMINAKPEAPSLVSAPLPLEIMDKGGDGVSAAEATQVLGEQTPSTSKQPLMSSTFVLESPSLGDKPSVPLNKDAASTSAPQTFPKIESSSLSTAVQQKESSSLFGGDGLHMKKSEGIPVMQVQQTTVNSQMEMPGTLSLVHKRNEVQSGSQNSYVTAIVAEIQSFVKELQDLKELQNSAPTMDGEEDRVALQTYASNLQNFQKDIVETMQAISTEIYTLKNALLESFVMVEEAYSRERHRNDHSYITMLKERALDPVTAKRMQKINQRYQYLSTQIQEVSNKLDQEFINLYSNKKRAIKNNLIISSTDAIYKTIVNNGKSIHNLKKKIEMLMKKAEERKRRNTTKSASWGRYHKRSMPEDLSKLADEFLQVKIAPPEEESAVSKKLSSESQNVLKEFLRQSNVVTVRPTAVYSSSQSRLLSNAALSEDTVSNNELVKSISPKPTSNLAKEKVPEITSSENQMPTPASKLSLSFGTSNNMSAPITPVFEPITPPDVVNPSVPANETFASNKTLEPSRPSKELSGFQVCQPPSNETGASDSLVKNSSDQNIGLNDANRTVKNNVENPPSASYSGGKSFFFNQTSAESVPSVASSQLFPKTPSFAASTQKVSETVISKPLAISNNTMISSATSSFQFSSSFGPQKVITPSFASNDSSITSTTKISFQPDVKNPTESVFNQPNTSLAPLSANTLGLSRSPNFSLPITKASQVSSTSLFTVPENKSAPSFLVSGDKNPSGVPQTKNNLEFFFQKPSDSISQPNVSLLKKDVISESSSLTADSETSVLNMSLQKSDSVDSKSSGKQTLNIQLGEVEKSVSTCSTSTSTSQTLFATAAQTESSVAVNSQPIITSTFSNFSDLKQPVSSSGILNSVASEAVTTIPVNVITQSTIPLPESSANVSKSPSAPPITSVANISTPDVAKTMPSTLSVPVVVPVSKIASPTTTLFSQNAVVSTAVSSVSSSDVTAIKTESSAAPVFGAKPTPAFGQPSTETPSFFGAGNTFGETPVTQSTPFGQTTPNSSFPAAPGGFFSQMPNFGANAVATATTTTTTATATATTTTTTDFNSQASTFSFGKSTFGQTTGSFGLAKSFFGQNTTPFTQTGSSPSSFSFSQNSNSVFGQGSFFSGLGGKPSEENASKNVFSLNSSIKSNTDTNNLFRNSSATSFGAVNSGSFSSSGSFSAGGGSVAQAGFGAFQQNTSPQSVGGFGSTPSFGGAPTFGSPPAFGASPTFGSGNALSSSLFGQQQVSSNFSNFANASSPTFGSLASQSSGFGSSSMMGGFGSQGTGFGSAPVFGGSSFGGQSPGFGSPSSPPSNSSAFTQWRN